MSAGEHEPAADEPAADSGAMPLPLTLGAGLLMGAADAVPGVSGGTIALIIGIYHRFIGALSTALRVPLRAATPERWRAWREAVGFMLPLGVGILLAYYLVTWLLVGSSDAPGILRREATARYCYGFFFGLVLVSLREPWRRIAAPRELHFGAAAASAVVVALFVGLPYATHEPATWMLLYGGVVAITVMLLPGVSGALALVVIGQYTTVAAAVHDGDAVKLAVFALGVVLGMFTVVPLLRYLLARHNDLTMAVLTGFMAGSLRALWPWKGNYDVTVAPMVNTGVGEDRIVLALVLLAALAGGVTVWLLTRIERRLHPAADDGERKPNPPRQDDRRKGGPSL